MTSTNRRLRPITITALALLLLLLPACGGGGEEAPTEPRGGTIVLGSISDVDSWNEYLSKQSFAVNLLRRVYLRLAAEPVAGARSADAYTPLLAESWEAGADGLSLTFHLRNAEWSDGAPVTADDVRFTWQAQTSEQVPWVGAGSKSHIADVEVQDDRTVTFRFDQPYPYQLADAVDGGILPRHVFGAIPFEQWATHDWTDVHIGSGPFVLESHRPGVETVLVRNPRYFEQGYPLADRVVVRYVPDIENLLTQLLAGEIDFLDGIPPRDAHRLADDPSVGVIPYDYPSYDYLGWNERRPPFDDSRVRRAMTLAIDRPALVEDLLYGYGRVGIGPVPSSWWGADPDLEPLPYDPAEARRLLAEAGFAAGDGTAGRPLAFDLVTNSGNRLREEMLVKIQEQLSRVGVRASVRTMEQRAMIGSVVAGDYDGYLGSWVFIGRVELGTFFDSASMPPAGYNVVGYRSDEADALFARIEKATDLATLVPLLHEVQRIIHRDQPYTLLYETQRVAAHGSGIDGVVIDIPSDPLARLERFRVR